MLQQNLHMPPEVQHLIDERTKLWAELDAAQKLASQLDQYAQKVGGLNQHSANVVSRLTNAENPSDEISATAQEIVKELKKIEEMEKEILATNNQVESITQRAKRMTATVIIGGVLLLAFIGFLILNVLK